MAEWRLVATADGAEDEWMFLRSVRDAVNAALEPMRAAKALNSTAEAEVMLRVPAAVSARTRGVRQRAAGLPDRGACRSGVGADGAAIEARGAKTTLAKCERCWTYRRDVGADGVCARCVAALAATGRSAGA
jgi:isoleucyl-tRNA synthetase